MFKNIICMTALAAVVAPAFAAEWMTDFEAAKAKAAQENKAILVDFTGSDWCGFCIKLRKEVLDTPDFEAYAADKFVLMEVDMPRKKQLPTDLLVQNQKLCAEYNIEGFPTLLVLTPQGQVMGGLSGFRPTVQEACAPLDQALLTWELVKKADAAEGDAKAQHLMDAYQSVPEDMRGATGLLQQIAAADPENKTGVQAVAKEEQQSREIDRKFRECGNDPAKLKAAIDEFLPVATPKNKQKLEEALASINSFFVMKEVGDAYNAGGPAAALAVIEEKLAEVPAGTKLELLTSKFELQLLSAEKAEDLEAVKATAAELRAEMPAHMVQGFDEFIAERFAAPETLLQQVKEEREKQEKARAERKK